MAHVMIAEPDAVHHERDDRRLTAPSLRQVHAFSAIASSVSADLHAGVELNSDGKATA
ncbi:MAG: hypothetical protein IT184_01865 [Acidobacteria bacterium]|nr:hypothetical protein [Acidobacteriota bacterium]